MVWICGVVSPGTGEGAFPPQDQGVPHSYPEQQQSQEVWRAGVEAAAMVCHVSPFPLLSYNNLFPNPSPTLPYLGSGKEGAGLAFPLAV